MGERTVRIGDDHGPLISYWLLAIRCRKWRSWRFNATFFNSSIH